MKFSSSATIAALVASLPASSALCPGGYTIPAGAEGETHASWVLRRRLSETRKLDELPPPPEPSPEYAEAVAALDIEAVQEDIKAVMTDSQDFWPADYGNYGPFFIRLAWHCAGTFRIADGRGGCGGGRQRFYPEMNWADNTNLDKARRLLWPVKEKYGIGLSWGDLFVAAGTTAIQSMGGPTLGVCFGRVDDEDGERSVGLDQCPPGEEDGNCTAPMGATTMGLIYVNPEGPFGVPIPEESAGQIRSTFSRMGMNDSETIALIGGGHAFGKTHGACSDKTTPGAEGKNPFETSEEGLDPDTESWQGKCGTGVGADTWTSGFEGPWTINPIQWDNSYFTILQDYQWTNMTGPGGHQQWHDTAIKPQGLGAFGGTEEIMMLTSDVSLLRDPEGSYQGLVKEFAENPNALDEAFAAAWHKLTTAGFGNEDNARCTGAPVYDREADKVDAADETADEPADETIDEPADETVDTSADETGGEQPADSPSESGAFGSHALIGTALYLLAAQAILFCVL